MSILSRKLKKNIKKNKANLKLSLKILNNYNSGKYNNIRNIIVKDIPGIDGESILDIGNIKSHNFPISKVQKITKELNINIETLGTKIDKNTICFNCDELEKIGVQLFPSTAYGVLNGGSASSYIDKKKNSSFNEDLFKSCTNEFNAIADISEGKAKGLTPAYTNPDGSPGYSFMELKMRALLIQTLKYQIHYKKETKKALDIYQMTSVFNNSEIKRAYKKYTQSDLIKDLIKETGNNICNVSSGVQPLLTAYTHSKEGKTKSIFKNADGINNNIIAMPGGHGQSFLVLKDIFTKLYKEGKRFAYLGNVDNLGNTVDPISLALLALSGKPAGFDFAFKTPVDVKGGILIKDDKDKLNCADIGPAITEEDVKKAEESGKKILFNCATGLFSLEYLINNIDKIISTLPMRFSDQDKDKGKYSQAEQVTWEVIGLLDDFLIFAIKKEERFLAAKMLIESLITSGIGLEYLDGEYKKIAQKLNKGLEKKLINTYGLKVENNKWVPKTINELKKEFQINNTTKKSSNTEKTLSSSR